ncbi:NAD(P)/FAD-dependent oxidoreductase [Micromonospora sp. PLK6-60]|uniref:phytoene desaturase family protein n=1 Tax=Micromonospora sp. PLK6-60 TaxID=2873383 RepID=UPI001CA6D709|nr:NAD(P)/FAD-dependent oxidoreductase [Micromonospora sp. PLK6-60]MBY8870997.1 NAD(P)/FAD-dependent oxidoreductase [Micromonospora sp. PLK6-60]
MTDAAVVGTGPNGLAAAVVLARAGLRVSLWEQADTVGGGLRTRSLFDRDVRHDVCSAIHPMAAASAFFREFDLPARGVRLLQPEIPYAHPLPDGPAAAAWRSLDRTAEHLGVDGPRWAKLMGPLVARSAAVVDLLLADQRSLPRDLAAPALLAPRVLAHATTRSPLRTEAARALLTGVAAHAVGRLPSVASTVVALLLGHTAHSTGWPVPEGGSGRIADALLADVLAHGGTVHTGHRVRDLAELADAPIVLLDVGPKEFLAIAGDRLPPRYRRALRRYRYGPGAAKADFLVDGPIPWRDPVLGAAGTVHLGGTRADIIRAENATVAGVPVDEPFALVVDPAVTDPSRAAGGRRPVWAYAHVPNGDRRDPVDLLRRLIERYAPGFSDTVIEARGIAAADYEAYNPNYVGGDIGGGALTLRQALARPTARRDPYATPLPGVYLCSSATPPGPSVHGMCGHLAARSALRRHGIRSTPDLSPRPARSTLDRA